MQHYMEVENSQEQEEQLSNCRALLLNLNSKVGCIYEKEFCDMLSIISKLYLYSLLRQRKKPYEEAEALFNQSNYSAVKARLWRLLKSAPRASMRQWQRKWLKKLTKQVMQ